MKPVSYLMQAFSTFFGISKPRPEQEAKVAALLVAVFALIFIGTAAFGFFIIHLMSTR